MKKIKKIVVLLCIFMTLILNTFSSLAESQSEVGSSGTQGNVSKTATTINTPIYTIVVVDETTNEQRGPFVIIPKSKEGFCGQAVSATNNGDTVSVAIPVAIGVSSFPENGFQLSKSKFGGRGTQTFADWALNGTKDNLSEALSGLMDELGITDSLPIPSTTTHTDANTGASVTFSRFGSWLVGLSVEADGTTKINPSQRYVLISNWQYTKGVGWKTSPEIETKQSDGATLFGAAQRHIDDLKYGITFNAVQGTRCGVVWGGSIYNYDSSSSSDPPPPPTPPTPPTSIDKYDKMILFEDELSYIYDLFQGNADVDSNSSAQRDVITKNKHIKINGTVSPTHHEPSTCSLGSSLRGCSSTITLNTVLSYFHSFSNPADISNYIALMGSSEDSSSICRSEAEISGFVSKITSTPKTYSFALRESPQNQVKTFEYIGEETIPNLFLNQIVQGYRSKKDDLRSLWPNQINTLAQTDMGYLDVKEGSSSNNARTRFHLNKYSGDKVTLTANKDGEYTKTWGYTYTASVNPTTIKCTGTYQYDAGCHEETTESGGTRRVHEHDTKECEAILTATVDASDLNAVAGNITFVQYYEVGYENLGDEVGPNQKEYVTLGGKNGNFIRATIHGDNDSGNNHVGRSSIIGGDGGGSDSDDEDIEEDGE